MTKPAQTLDSDRASRDYALLAQAVEDGNTGAKEGTIFHWIDILGNRYNCLYSVSTQGYIEKAGKHEDEEVVEDTRIMSMSNITLPQPRVLFTGTSQSGAPTSVRSVTYSP